MWCPITDEGMSWPPADLIEEFWDRICDRNSQTANPYIYLLPTRSRWTWTVKTGK